MADEKKKMGRPTKLTPEVRERILVAVRAGNYWETAALFAGIDKKTFYNWLKRGNQAKRGIYHDFVHALEKAGAEAEIRDVTRVDQAGDTDWKAAAWRLERRNAAHWGRKDRMEVSGAEDAQPVKIQAKVEVTEEIDHDAGRIAGIIEILRGAGVLPDAGTVPSSPAGNDAETD